MTTSAPPLPEPGVRPGRRPLPPPTGRWIGPPTGLGVERPGSAWAGLLEVDGRTAMYVEVGGKEAATGCRPAEAEAEVVARAFTQAGELGVPVLAVVGSLSVDPVDVAGLAAWGRVARAAVHLSGVVPLLLAVTGPCHGGLATLLGLADHVVLTRGATAYVNGPRAVAALTALHTTPDRLGGARVHAAATGLCSLVAEDRDDAVAALADLLSYLPPAWDGALPVLAPQDPVARRCRRAASAVPDRPQSAYDVRTVLADVADAGSVVELWADHAPNVVTAYARLGGRPVAVVANQPQVRAGTLDIAASSKVARHVQGADAAGLPLLTLVDTPGFEPGKDLEWRGMIRHGAEMVHAYCAATVPRVCVILRKSYGGAYIVMDSRAIGSDLVLAWPGAEIAVMGAPGAVAVLHRREIAEATDPDSARRAHEDAYRARYCSPALAAAHGDVDEVIAPEATRAHLVVAFARLAGKRPRLPERRHSISPC